MTYGESDFNQLKLYNLNHDQILALLKSKNFLQTARPSKLVDSLVHLQRTRQLKLYKERQEICDCVNMLMENLQGLEPSYVVSLTHTLAKMKFDDH